MELVRITKKYNDPTFPSVCFVESGDLEKWEGRNWKRDTDFTPVQIKKKTGKNESND